jgi:hypothetical protein
LKQHWCWWGSQLGGFKSQHAEFSSFLAMEFEVGFARYSFFKMAFFLLMFYDHLSWYQLKGIMKDLAYHNLGPSFKCVVAQTKLSA